jgi:hypothetical protein
MGNEINENEAEGVGNEINENDVDEDIGYENKGEARVKYIGKEENDVCGKEPGKLDQQEGLRTLHPKKIKF